MRYFDIRIRCERLKSRIKLINQRKKCYKSLWRFNNGYMVWKGNEELPYYLTLKDIQKCKSDFLSIK